LASGLAQLLILIGVLAALLKLEIDRCIGMPTYILDDMAMLLMSIGSWSPVPNNLSQKGLNLPHF